MGLILGILDCMFQMTGQQQMTPVELRSCATQMTSYRYTESSATYCEFDAVRWTSVSMFIQKHTCKNAQIIEAKIYV